jgi:hypothetical protein
MGRDESAADRTAVASASGSTDPLRAVIIVGFGEGCLPAQSKIVRWTSG